MDRNGLWQYNKKGTSLPLHILNVWRLKPVCESMFLDLNFQFWSEISLRPIHTEFKQKSYNWIMCMSRLVQVFTAPPIHEAPFLCSSQAWLGPYDLLTRHKGRRGISVCRILFRLCVLTHFWYRYRKPFELYVVLLYRLYEWLAKSILCMYVYTYQSHYKKIVVL